MVRLSPALLVAAVASLWSASASDAAEAYRLGPQDELQIKVFDLRQGTGEAFQWKAFEGTFAVGAAGQLSLPLVGDLPAEGKTVDELAKAVAASLQSRVGLTALPDASVQIVRYRPIFVLGLVSKPGAYPYQPGLTVLETLGLAGGLERGSEDALLGFERDALTTRGDIRVLGEERLALSIRQARLDAEIAGVNAIALPDDARAAMGEAAVGRLVKEEQLLFEARRHAIDSQVASLEQSKTILQEELSSLAQKDASLAHQASTTSTELANITGLVSRGLTVLPRQLELEQSTAQIQSARLDVSVDTLRAKQDIAKADRDILELKNSRRSDALQEATQVHNRLAELEQRIGTDRALIDHVEVRAPAALSDRLAAERSPTFRITRRVDGAPLTMAAARSDAVQPGDVVEVVVGGPPAGADTAQAEGSGDGGPAAGPAVSRR